jgi:hypothetical protein
MRTGSCWRMGIEAYCVDAWDLHALGMDGFELCQPVDEEDFEKINVEIGGKPRQFGWKPIPMRLIHRDEQRTLERSDSPWLGSGTLIFRASVLDALGSLLMEYGELLPLSCPEADLVVYKPRLRLDALDQAASSVLRFSDGRIMLIQQHVFRSAVVGENDIFTIPSLRVSPTYLSHRFVDRWKASGFKGLGFVQVWMRPN